MTQRDGVRVWIATDKSGEMFLYFRKPEWDYSYWCSAHGFVQLPTDRGISVPPGECVEFRLVPFCEVAEQPQSVPVSPLALWIADKSFALAIECLRMGKPLTADDMAKLVEQTVVASRAAAARIEGGADGLPR